MDNIDMKIPVFSKILATLLCVVTFVVLSVSYTLFIHGQRLQPRIVSVQECPAANTSFVTVVPGGRLGNGIFEYLSTWTFAQEVNAVPVVPVEIFQQLSVAFQQFDIPQLEDMACTCGFNLLTEVMKNQAQYEGSRTKGYTVLPQVTVLRKYAFDWKSLIAYWPELHKLLHFHPHLLRKSQTTLAEIARLTNCSEYVAVHVRRTDYLQYIHSYKNATAAEASFYLAAMDLLRERLATPLAFVIVSDDPEWCKINLKSSPDTIVVGNNNSPEADLALMASCNHTIFDYGTYGLTAAMFNVEGQTVVYNTGSTDYFLTYQFPLKLNRWTKLGNSR